MYLARKGYGSLAEMRELDTPDVLDLIEYEHIQNDLERYHYDNPEG